MDESSRSEKKEEPTPQQSSPSDSKPEGGKGKLPWHAPKLTRLSANKAENGKGKKNGDRTKSKS